ncbi:MAG: calcium-translocating P-type ATPase, PMCA-type [Gallionellales bacterium 35-53-114]|jgi:Ca2+-transporting ATPase|nr:MAG: calcium-translocating P-type ATPase, PMCA-type [Gallionellales bacterium 35-53-114]OYZ63259.1 MAG: calcium-translocating P-type ATPase, PMCA-type [Gallionellales bacterium 24-53-125]OZB08721.1 MAG: calcium-translocating P-type ATPase, PMCA-type [Gallionellales bacterium 39-52-133]HQS57408.1 calcium-translocating P-type ATPase, PMCA-type [Gallionellaceae bacterium]HQS74404.1 calcium-translocating P-type ATPase, PMCA-type [Gallionellaceae bacterium]
MSDSRHPKKKEVLHWHALSAEEVLLKTKSALKTGLSVAEAKSRLIQYGRNVLVEKAGRSLWRMLLDQFSDFMILVLIAAAVISGLIGDAKDTIAIIVIVVLNAVIGFVQEYRAERAMAALKAMAAVSAKVLRNGEIVALPASEIVPGDVVVLEAGNVIPADLRLLEAVQLKVDEAALTGESLTVEKHTLAIAGDKLTLGDRKNLAYKGTVVTYGRGLGVVVATGMESELGKIAASLQEDGESKTPLQKRLASFGKRLALVVIAICAIVFAVGVMRGEGAVLMFLTAISLAVAAIPEALPAVVTISLALGARKMVKQHALVRRLPAVETLGSVTYICTDKTGTLTQNKMKVEEIFVDGELLREWGGHERGGLWELLFRALALSNDASQSKHGKPGGDPTEVALYVAALEAGFDKVKLEQEAPRLLELPFDSERKRMTTFHRDPQGAVAFTKGAPESLLPRCSGMLTAQGNVPLPLDEMLATAERMAADGLRVLALAYRAWPTLPEANELNDSKVEEIESSLVFLGLIGLMDPPRREAHEAVSLCRTAGIIPVMITGDHPQTARAIATRLGIVSDGGKVMTGAELEQLSEAQFEEQVLDIRVYARVDPQQKIKIVKALQDKGEFVAMTGDGVNDAPALKRADIGIAMGKGGTDVAREASALVLLDDNFATIVHAIREGRRIFDNIRKFIKYTMTSNAGEVWTIFLAPLMGLPIPLLPIHILWINLVTDGLPGLALAAEPAEKGIMRRKPRPPKESIFAHGMWQHMLWVGLLMGGVSLITQAWSIHTGSAHWQTMVFTVLCLSQMGHVLAIRSETQSLFRIGLFSNPLLLAAVALTFTLQMATIYVPFLQPIFKTEALSMDELLLCIALSAVVFFAVEIEKLLVRRGVLYQNG